MSSATAFTTQLPNLYLAVIGIGFSTILILLVTVAQLDGQSVCGTDPDAAPELMRISASWGTMFHSDNCHRTHAYLFS